MEKILVKIKKSITKNLNEYVKWVIILALYLFYRMMATIYPTEYLDFLILPLILIGISILISDRIIDPLIEFNRIIKNPGSTGYSNSTGNVIVSIFYIAGILMTVVYYITSLYSLINLALFFVLCSGLLAYIFLFQRHEKAPKIMTVITILVLLVGVAAFIHGFVFQNNAVNFISIIFYALFLVHYFISNYITKAEKPDNPVL